MPRPMRVEIDGAKVLAAKLRKLPNSVRTGLRHAVTGEVDEVADDMRRGAPRDTGELIESIQAEVYPDGLGGTVAATARHATFVEHGTEDTPAQPFAVPAAERARRRFPDRIRRDVGIELDELTQ